MKNNTLNLVGLLGGIVIVGALIYLLYTSLVSRPSQTGGQTRQAEPLTSEPLTSEPLTSAPTEISDVAAPLTDTPPATSDLGDSLTPTFTTVTETAEQRDPIPNIEVPPISHTYLYSNEVTAIEGRLVAHGVNTYPDAYSWFNSRFESYRLAELDLPNPVPVTINGKTTQISVVWRLTVAGGPFEYGAQPWAIWLDDVRLGLAQLHNRMTELSVIVVDRSLLRNGTTIFVSYSGIGTPIAELDLSGWEQ